MAQLPPFVYTTWTHLTHKDSLSVLTCQATFPMAARFHKWRLRIPKPPNFFGMQTFDQFMFPGLELSLTPNQRNDRQKELIKLITFLGRMNI